jgi:NADP-dependent 3-hydroxy acid dehydrogenase YdfG
MTLQNDIIMKTILITGASSGIGKAAAIKFAASGWNVIATMRSPEKEQELALLDHVFVTRLDVQDIESIKQAIESGIEKFGKIDTLLNNAGYMVIGAFELATDKQIHTQFDINVFGVMNTIQAILPHFRSNQAGTIINVTSTGGRITFPTCSLYHATKFAIEGFSESLSYELLSQNILVKIVEPGSTHTNFVAAANVTENPDITAYDDFNILALKNWYKNDTMQSSAEDISEVIYTAATDGTNHLRYIAGRDTKRYFEIRQSGTDQEYVDQMRKIFIPEVLERQII